MTWLLLQAAIVFSCLLIMWAGANGIRTGRVRGKGWSGIEILTGASSSAMSVRSSSGSPPSRI